MRSSRNFTVCQEIEQREGKRWSGGRRAGVAVQMRTQVGGRSHGVSGRVSGSTVVWAPLADVPTLRINFVTHRIASRNLNLALAFLITPWTVPAPHASQDGAVVSRRRSTRLRWAIPCLSPSLRAKPTKPRSPSAAKPAKPRCPARPPMSRSGRRNAPHHQTRLSASTSSRGELLIPLPRQPHTHTGWWRLFLRVYSEVNGAQ